MYPDVRECSPVKVYEGLEDSISRMAKAANRISTIEDQYHQMKSLQNSIDSQYNVDYSACTTLLESSKEMKNSFSKLHWNKEIIKLIII